MRTTVTASIPVMLWTAKTGISRNSRLPDSVANMLTVPRDGCPRHNARELTHPPFFQSVPSRFHRRHHLAQLLLSSIVATGFTKGVRNYCNASRKRLRRVLRRRTGGCNKQWRDARLLEIGFSLPTERFCRGATDNQQPG